MRRLPERVLTDTFGATREHRKEVNVASLRSSITAKQSEGGI